MNDFIKAALTPRQADVAERLLGGLSNREIAEGLGISTNAVKHHLQSMLDKFDVRGSGYQKRIRLARKLLCI